MNSRRSFAVPLPGGRRLMLGSRTLVMGVLNVTPDSFAEPAPRLDPAQAAADAIRMEAEGADLIEIGGESTRPGAEAVGEADERARVLPVLDRLAGRLGVPLAIDTSKAAVARAAMEAGVAIVNDVRALDGDPALGHVVAEGGAALVLMHSRGTPRDMAQRAHYGSLLDEVSAELQVAMARALAAGVPASQLILDPGIGFAKRPAHSYGVLAGLQMFAELGRPLMVGPSRKSFLTAAVGEMPAPERDWATAAAVTAAVLGGAHIVRVHAVREMSQVVRVADAVRRHAEGTQSPV